MTSSRLTSNAKLQLVSTLAVVAASVGVVAPQALASDGATPEPGAVNASAPVARNAKVRATFKHGKLTIAGTRAAERFKIVRTKSSIKIKVDGRQVKVSPRPTTANLSGIKVRAKGGDDVVRLVERRGDLPAAILQGGSGDDTLTGGSGSNRLVGRGGSDVLIGGPGRNFLDGGDGRDTLTGGPKGNTMLGGNGDDVLTGGAGSNTMNGQTGNDKIVGGGGSNVMNGGDDSDSMTGGSGDNLMNGGNGSDALVGGTGHNRLFGGSGDDVILGGPSESLINGGEGNDTMTGGAASDRLAGSGGNDVLNQSPGGDSLSGEEGNDVYALDADLPGGAVQLLEPVGSGVDTISLAATTTVGVSLDLGRTTTQTLSSTLSVRLDSGATFDNAIGGQLGDLLTGNTLVNGFTGGAGADQFIHHGAGDAVDTVTDMSAAQGDRVRFVAGGLVAAGDLTLDATATQLRDLATNTFGYDFTVPVLNGTTAYNYGSTDTATAGQLISYNGPGPFVPPTNADTLLTVHTAAAATINGAAGNDRIIDRSVNGNTLIGHAGQDVLTGGAGSDTFGFGEVSAGGPLEQFGSDVVADFSAVDTIDLAAGLSVHSGLGTLTVTIWDGVTDYGTITASNGRAWLPGDFT